LKRRVIASAFMFVGCCRELLANEEKRVLEKRSRNVYVEDCDDDDQSNGVGKGKLRVFGAFGNLSKCVGSHDGNGGSGSLIGIKFELDFHCCKQQDGPKPAADKSRYEEEQ
jgi:hypothetical protein